MDKIDPKDQKQKLINKVDEEEAIAKTTILTKMKTFIINAQPSTPFKAMPLIIMIITVTLLKQSNRITNLPVSTNLKWPLINIIITKRIVMRET